MNPRDGHSLPPDLQHIDERLRRERPDPSGLELDELKRRVDTRRTRVATSRRAGAMGSRLGIAMMLVTGLVLSGGGTALGISGISGNGGNASVAQYVAPIHVSHPCSGQFRVLSNPRCNGVLGIGENGNGNENNEGVPSAGILGEENNESAAQQAAELRAEQQQAAAGAGKTLPFTGYLAIPVLLIGLALLASGLVIRRRSYANRD